MSVTIYALTEKKVRVEFKHATLGVKISLFGLHPAIKAFFVTFGSKFKDSFLSRSVSP